jgi:cysteine desulfurase/selenocysteine lyase
MNMEALPSLEECRILFPQLQAGQDGAPLVYLDTAASALKPESVLKRSDEFLRNEYATVNRALYGLGQQATAGVHRTRSKVASFVGAHQASQVVFTRGTTDAINLVALSMQMVLGPGDEIVVTGQEHHSNLVPWQMACARTGATLRILPLLPDGQWDLDALATTITPRCRLVACSAVSNVLGAWNPVASLVAAAKFVGARVLLDAAQAAGAYHLDLQELGVDFLAFSAHKLYGPTGLGVLVGTPDALESLIPVQGGGDMIDEVELERHSWAPLPHRLEAGTPPFAQIIGWEPALDLLQAYGPERIGAYLAPLQRRCAEGLAQHGFQILSAPTSRTICTVSHPDWHASDLAQLLACRGVAVRSGHLCAQPLLRHLGHRHVLRASLGLYSIQQDIDVLLQASAELVG